MKVKLFFVLALVIAVFLPSLSMGAESMHFFDCSECHRAGATVNELAGGNVCLRCHSSAAPLETTLNKGSRYNPTATYNTASAGTFDIGIMSPPAR